MKFLKSIAILFLALFLQGSHVHQNTCDIELIVMGLRNNTGQLMISLHLGPEGFPHDNMYQQLFITDFSSPTTTVVFNDVPYGDGAISLLHDENISGKMDFNIVHFPKEGFGFYRDFKVGLRQPGYNDISFQISQPNMNVEIKMQY